MSAVIKGLAGLLICSVLLIMWQQYRQLNLQRQLMDAQVETNQRVIAQLSGVVAAQESTADSISGLMRAQQTIQRNLSTRSTEIRRLQSDVSEIRDWADRPLPDAIIRLRDRPGTTGAAAFGAAVSAGGAVHADGDSAENER